MINDKLEPISFNVHNYFTLNNDNIIIANKYLFDISKYKFIDLNQDKVLYDKLSLSGCSPEISNIYDLDNASLIMPFLNQNRELIFNCYDKTLNEIKACNFDNDLYKYLFPLNKVFALNDDKYLIIVSFDPDDYKNNYDNTKSLQEPAVVKFVIWDSKNNTYNTIYFPNLLSYNVQTAFFDKKYIWIADENSNLFGITATDFRGSVKTNIPGNFYFARIFKIDADTLLIVSPVYNKPSVLSLAYFDINKNEIIKTNEIKYPDMQYSDFRTRKSYDAVQLKTGEFLINGGQSGTYAETTKTNESYLLKL